MGKDSFFIAGEKSLITAFQKSLSYEALPERSVFLLNKEHCLTEHAVSACQLADDSRINTFSASSLATLVQMTAFHHGVTFLPEMAVNKGVGKSEGLVINAVEGDVYREIGMLWRKTSMREQTFMALGNLVTDLLEK